jgi:hypothetical protein
MGTPDVEAILRQKLRLAELAFEAAKIELKEVTSDIPSGLPHPDGAGRIRNAGIAYRSAVGRYCFALSQFNEFLINGTIPEDLKEAIRIAYGGR